MIRKLIKIASGMAVAMVAIILFVGSNAQATVPVINELVSVNTTGYLPNDRSDSMPSISGDGRYVTFQSAATDIVANDTNGAADIFVRDRNASTTSRVNVTTTGGQSSMGADMGAISYTGRYVVFSSSATDLSADTVSGSNEQVFIRDRQTSVTKVVSKNSSGQEGDSGSSGAVVSADGRFVAFSSTASNLVSGVDPSGNGAQVFLKDMFTGNVQALSVNSSGAVGNAPSLEISMDCTGRVISFFSAASNLTSGDTNGVQDVFISNIGWSGTILSDITQSGNMASSVPSVSCDGNKIALATNATNFPDGAGVYEYDRLSNAFTLVSQDTSGAIKTIGYSPSVSKDGRYVTFQTDTMLDDADTNGTTDIYVRDSKNGTTQLISRNSSKAVGNTYYTALSADGSYVAYVFQEGMYSPNGFLVGAYDNDNPSLYVSKTGF